MNNNPLFSIIIPTYNRSTSLKRALESIEKQSFKDFEVIVCDDGSTDDTKQIAEEFSKRMDVTYIYDEHWGGPARPRNNGLKIAKGKYIAFLDSDDWWYPHKLKIVKKYIDGSDADVIYHDLDIYTPKGKNLFKKVKGRRLKKPVFVDLMVNENAIINSSVIAKKKIINEACWLSEDKSLISVEDFDLWLKISRISEKFLYIPKSLGAYYIIKGNISEASSDKLRKIENIYNKHLGFLKEGDKKQATSIMNYLIGRTKQKIGLLDESLHSFRIASHSKNIKFKIRSLCWMIILRIRLNYINYIAISAIFSEAIVIHFSNLFGVGWYIKVYNFILLFVLSILLLKKKLRLDYNFIRIFLLIIICSLFVFNSNNNAWALSEQAIAILLHSAVFYSLIKLNNGNIKKLFSIYLNIAFLVALIGMFQELFYLINRYFLNSNENMGMLYDFKWLLPHWDLSITPTGMRLNSIMPEPFSFCLVMFPAFFTSLAACLLKRNDFQLNLWKKSIIIITFILTFSLVGYIAALCALTLIILNKLRNKLRFAIFLILMVLAAVILYQRVPDIKIRVDQIYKISTNKMPLEKANLSIYTFMRNILITKEVLKDGLALGHGLGSHDISYEKLSSMFKTVTPGLLVEINKADANSLFLRILSETGIFGFLIFITFIINFFIAKKKDTQNYLWIINNSIFVLFIMRLIRQGNYVSEGFFFFFWLYYFSKKITDQNKLNQ